MEETAMKTIKKICITLASLGVAATVIAAEPQLPNIKILATGGTIAGSAASSTSLTNYKAGTLPIDTLLNAVPEIKKFANISGEQIASIGSQDITDDVWLKLARRCNELLADPSIDGIVITHGTDTLEETAYFLNLTLKSTKPVVLVGSQRPATAISADGPLNLMNAVRVAMADQSHDKGVLVAMNEEINAAREVTKTNTTNVETFRSPLFGYLGIVVNGEPMYFRAPTKLHTTHSIFNIDNIKTLPRVDIVYSHANDDGVLVDASRTAGAKGIIHAGTGNGSVHKNTLPALQHASQSGMIVVRASRVGSGMVTPEADGFIFSHTLNPQKARVSGILCLGDNQP